MEKKFQKIDFLRSGSRTRTGSYSESQIFESDYIFQDCKTIAKIAKFSSKTVLKSSLHDVIM